MSKKISIILIVLLTLAGFQTSYAAFPTRAKAQAQHFTVQEPMPTPKVAEQAIAAGDEIGYAIASFLCGVMSLPLTTLGIVVLALGSGAIGLFLAGGILSVIAIVLGALGFRKKLRGLAIAGFVLGIISALYFFPFILALAAGGF